MKAKLLAPAGSFEAMKAAFAAGADECYIGGTKFGARAYADNLDTKQLLQAIDYAHLHGRKLYLTVNTLLKEDELEEQLYPYIKPFYEQGLDAVIVQDLGVLKLIKSAFPELPIHASTQMTVTGAAAAQMLEELGVTRIVTPRELSLLEIAEIRAKTGLEIESFVHGALCYCYSGQCLFSSLLGGRSGNRGRCAQPCRLPYQLYVDNIRQNTGAGRYLLSPKDMCTIAILPEILNAGVTALKIEGRMKKPEYTAGVVRIYRKYLDLLAAGKDSYQVDPADQKELQELFNRDGFNQSYFQVRNGREMMAFKNEKQDSAGKDRSRPRNEALFAALSSQYIEPRVTIPISGRISLLKGNPVEFEVTAADQIVTAVKGLVETAANQPLSEARVRQQLTKTGNTPFNFARLSITIDDDIFVPMTVLNELRREALKQLEEQLTAGYRRVAGERRPLKQIAGQCEKPGFTVLADTLQQLRAAAEAKSLEAVYCNCTIFDKNNFVADLLPWLQRFSQTGVKLFLSLPYVVRAADLDQLLELFPALLKQGLAGFLVHSLEGYALLRQKQLERFVVVDYQIYTMNERSRMFWQQQGILYDTITPELNERELRCRSNYQSEMIIYGYSLMMISAQCLPKNTGGCQKRCGSLWLQDRYQKKFYVKCECDFCYNVIYNSVPLGLLKEYRQVKKLGCKSLRLSFTSENYRQTQKIIQMFQAVYLYEQDIDDYETFTKGHFKRGVE